MRNLVFASLLVLAATLAAALPAQATYPGANGQIAFARTLEPSTETRAIFAINADGSGERQLTNPAVGIFDDQPDWSPDGSKIAFERCGSSHCELWVMNADGTGAVRMGPDCEGAPSPACEDRSGGAWSPDGKSIAFNRAWGAVQNDQIQHSELWVMDADGSHARPITHITTHHPYTADVGNAMWSPNGKSLVLSVLNSALGKPAGHMAALTIHADGTGLRRLTPWKLDGGDHPDWSPDGKRILFRTVSADEQHGDVYTIRPNGTGLTRLTHYSPSTILLSSSFSPDGQSITFAKGGLGGQGDIFTMRVDGTGVSPVTQTTLPEGAPDWGPAH
jgi:TolB protein